jgi:hypothetical protein
MIVSTVRWVETIAVGIVVYQRTDSAFLVAMMTMLRLLPMGLFGVFLGALAERFRSPQDPFLCRTAVGHFLGDPCGSGSGRAARGLASGACQFHQRMRLEHR